jgi:ribosomal protein S18 acetylase RimI-like enzyme
LIHVKKIRAARGTDLAQVVEIDALITGLRKPAYWAAVMKRYGGRYFLVFHEKQLIQGYVVGEIRDWEFGAPPCGWVFGLGVRPQSRLAGIGSQLLEALCERFRASGIDTVRTLLARDNALVLAFFRSQGMRAAPFMALEKRLD